MRINKINPTARNQNKINPNFKALALTSKGAYSLAGYFVENPGLEDAFMKQIAQPLAKLKTIVRYDSSTVKFLTPLKESAYLITQCYGKRFNPYAMVMGLSGHHSHISEPYYLKVLNNPTDNFENTNYVFRELEAAKNIAEDTELQLEECNNEGKITLPRDGETKFNSHFKEPGELVLHNNFCLISFEKYTKKAEELMKKFPDFL